MAPRDARFPSEIFLSDVSLSVIPLVERGSRPERLRLLSLNAKKPDRQRHFFIEMRMVEGLQIQVLSRPRYPSERLRLVSPSCTKCAVVVRRPSGLGTDPHLFHAADRGDSSARKPVINGLEPPALRQRLHLS